MLVASLLAQKALALTLPMGEEIIAWVILVGGFVGLYVFISRTRKRSYRAYLERSDREAELRANDPDLRNTDET